MGVSELATQERFAVIQWSEAAQIYNGTEKQHAVGLWTAPHSIVIRSDHLDREYVIKHELVHDLLGEGAHRDVRFTRCAGV